MEHDLKLAFLDAVFKRKETLFGRFSSKLTTVEKNEHWEQVRVQLVANGFSNIPTTKNLRSVQWQNLQRRAKEKRDKSRRTGTGAIKLTNIDNRVLDILGRDSPVVVGLPVADLSRSQTSVERMSLNLGGETPNDMNNNSPERPKTPLSFVPRLCNGRPKKKRLREQEDDELQDLKKAKLLAEIAKLHSETAVNKAMAEKLKSEDEFNYSIVAFNRWEFDQNCLRFFDQEVAVETSD